MSYLGAFLQNHMSTARITQRAMAVKLGLGVSHVSRILAGKRKGLDKETVAKMVSGISEDMQIQGELLRAYLLDQCPIEVGKLVKIETTPAGPSRLLKETDKPSGRPDPISDLARQLRADNIDPRLIHTLKELVVAASHCPELQDLLEDLTKLEIGPKRRKKS